MAAWAWWGSCSPRLLPGTSDCPPNSVADYLVAMSVAPEALPVVGALLAVLRPRSPIGWLLLVGGVTLILQDFVPAYVERSTLVAPLPGYQLVDKATPAVAALAIPLLTVWLPLLFPDGRLPGARWRVVGAIAAVYTAVAVALTLVPEPEQPVRGSGRAWSQGG